MKKHLRFGMSSRVLARGARSHVIAACCLLACLAAFFSPASSASPAACKPNAGATARLRIPAAQTLDL